MSAFGRAHSERDHGLRSPIEGGLRSGVRRDNRRGQPIGEKKPLHDAGASRPADENGSPHPQNDRTPPAFRRPQDRPRLQLSVRCVPAGQAQRTCSRRFLGGCSARTQQYQLGEQFAELDLPVLRSATNVDRLPTGHGNDLLFTPELTARVHKPKQDRFCGKPPPRTAGQAGLVFRARLHRRVVSWRAWLIRVRSTALGSKRSPCHSIISA
jgi:hypothetical protein